MLSVLLRQEPGALIYLLLPAAVFGAAAARHAGARQAAGLACGRAVVPARDEPTHDQSIGSLLPQDYPGPLTVVLVDDGSSDGTKEIAERTAAGLSAGARFIAVRGRGLPHGWTGKLWAVDQGIALSQRPTYLLLTDADIVHAPENLRWLVAHAEAGRFVLVSLMAKLRCESLAERSHDPAFIFFFQMLYPFSWVNRTDRTTRRRGRGCMLVRADTSRRRGIAASAMH